VYLNAFQGCFLMGRHVLDSPFMGQNPAKKIFGVTLILAGFYPMHIRKNVHGP